MLDDLIANTLHIKSEHSISKLNSVSQLSRTATRRLTTRTGHQKPADTYKAAHGAEHQCPTVRMIRVRMVEEQSADKQARAELLDRDWVEHIGWSAAEIVEAAQMPAPTEQMLGAQNFDSLTVEHAQEWRRRYHFWKNGGNDPITKNSTLAERVAITIMHELTDA
jgi:hypothetical protein